jgi:PHD/YefM family antitoxin component YafN of YafNO toxin-antitoxin module
MLIQDRFISTSELQQNVAKTIDKAKKEDVIIIRNNKLEAAIISIDKYSYTRLKGK